MMEKCTRVADFHIIALSKQILDTPTSPLITPFQHSCEAAENARGFPSNNIYIFDFQD